MKFLLKEDILLIHSFIIDETGGSHGVRDYHAIMTAEALPKQKLFGKEAYPTIFLKAAVYARTIMFSHPFIDGNKRTAMAIAFVFLENNGHIAHAKEGEIEQFALRVVREKLALTAIAAWFRRHARKR